MTWEGAGGRGRWVLKTIGWMAGQGIEGKRRSWKCQQSGSKRLPFGPRGGCSHSAEENWKRSVSTRSTAAWASRVPPWLGAALLAIGRRIRRPSLPGVGPSFPQRATARGKSGESRDAASAACPPRWPCRSRPAPDTGANPNNDALAVTIASLLLPHHPAEVPRRCVN